MHLILLTTTLWTACSTDGRLDGRDIQAFCNCFAFGGTPCTCWDLDDSGALNAADVGLLVTAILRDIPFGVADHFGGPYNTPVSGNVLTNDLDPHGPGTTAAIATFPAHGIVSLGSDGSMTYTPTTGFAGLDSFSYQSVNAYGPSEPVAVHILICGFNFGNCDGSEANGCETSLTSLSNCGSCGGACSLPNASATCSTGQCRVASCNNGFSNCDGIDSSGCEVVHDTYPVPGYCGIAGAEFVGSACGDLLLSCTASNWYTFATRTGRGEAWFGSRVNECNLQFFCCADLTARITLQVPPGIDYDLYAWSACGVLLGSSANGTGQTDQITLSRNDTCGGFSDPNDSFDFWIEVRWYSGGSCSNWTVTFEGRN